MRPIKALMKRKLVVADPAETVGRVTRRMVDHGLGAVLIVDDGKLTGILSERDIVKRVLVAGKELGSTPVGEVATPDPVAVSEDSPIKDCSRLIQRHGFRHLPVVDADGRPIGIISSRDFLQFMVERLEVFIDQGTRESRLEEIVDPFDAGAADGESGA